MCFCAEASFAVGGVLVPAGIYCVGAAIAKSPRYLGLAAVPLFFGIQQISEGFVWVSLHNGEYEHAHVASLVFLFFALAFWPFWFPFFSALMETHAWRRWVLGLLSLFCLAWFWVLYYPLLMEPALLRTEIVHHSIYYEFSGLVIYQYVPRTVLRFLYFGSLAVPAFVSTERWGWLPSLMLGASAIFAAIVFYYAYVSVWCFFAAVMASYICVIMRRLAAPTPMNEPKFEQRELLELP